MGSVFPSGMEHGIALDNAEVEKKHREREGKGHTGLIAIFLLASNCM